MKAQHLVYGSDGTRALEKFGTYNRDSEDSWESTRGEDEAQENKICTSSNRLGTAIMFILITIAAAVLITLQTSPSTLSSLQNLVVTAVTSGRAGDSTLPTDISVGQDVTTDISVGQDVTLGDGESMTFTTTRNGYDPLIYFTPLDLSIMKYTILEPYIGLIEPSADMTIELFGTADDKYYSFDVCSTADTSNCQTGYVYSTGNKESVNVNFACTPLEDEYLVTVNELSSQNDAVLRSSTGYALCMYVRREIRTLTEADRDKTMDAMFTMWSTNEAMGQNIYGKNFHSSTYLLEFHFFNAAWQDGDHIHEGLGFLHQHIKMSNIFEDSIQSIDPAVSLPYWDYTIESAQNISVMLSPMFTPEMFGSMPRSYDQYWGWTYRNDSMEAGAIADSRWMKIKADKNDRYDDLSFAYGYLRAPWNMNPSPYLSRFTSTNKHLPSCTSHYNLLDYDDLSDFLFQAPYSAHAATHGTIGGVFGCDMMDPMMEMGYILDDDAQINLCKNWIFYIKEFYRLNYLVPEQNCTLAHDSTGKELLDSDSLTCGYTCNPDETENFVFELKNILNSDNDCVPYDLQDKGWMAWKDFICTGDGYKIFGGDHLESASPADPSFWPIHPTLERLLQAKFMSGGFAGDDVWPSNPTTEYVCDKASCYDELYGFGYWDTCCYGHFEDDQLMDAAIGDRDSGYGLTNAEVHAYTDPTSHDYSMKYIYADFDWSHCELVGLDFVSLLESKAELAAAAESSPMGVSSDTTETVEPHDMTPSRMGSMQVKSSEPLWEEYKGMSALMERGNHAASLSPPTPTPTTHHKKDKKSGSTKKKKNKSMSEKRHRTLAAKFSSLSKEEKAVELRKLKHVTKVYSSASSAASLSTSPRRQ